MAVFLLVGLSAFGAITSSSIGTNKNGILGGPDIALAENILINSIPSATLISPSEITTQGYPVTYLSSNISEYGPLAAALNGASFPVNYSYAGLVTYKIKKGDTLSHVSARFNISIQTILSANPGLKASGLQIGQEIKILPTTGITYKVAEEDTPESIADSFGVELAHIVEFNATIDFTSLRPGESIVIPGANLDSRNTYTKDSSLPNLGNYFSIPTLGFNWGKLHQNNAVDIANSCGNEVRAAAEGLVIPDDNFGKNKEGWNGGYGAFVLIEHPNNIETRYAHLDEVLVEIGDYVKKGDPIGTMGNTGNVHGPTGCHLHFEVIGAQNPFAKY